MHHTIAWRLSIADVTATDVTPVPDTLMTISNGHFLPQIDYFVQYAYFGAAGAQRARLITPSFRQTTTPWIRPVQLSIVPLDEPNMADYRGAPLRLRALEEVQLEATQSTGGAAVVAAIAGISKLPMTPAPSGDIFTMRGTGTTTLVAGAWTLATITWQDTLPAGKYACVGFEYIGVTAISARLVFEEQWERPGTLGAGLVSSSGLPIFRKGGLGIWGYFNANRMPNVECLANAADTAEEVYLDLVRVG